MEWGILIMKNVIKRLPKDEILALVEKNMNYKLREIGEKTTAAIIENIMSSIIKDFNDENEREREFKYYIEKIVRARSRRVFGVDKNEVTDILRIVFGYNMNSFLIENKIIKNLCFEDKLMYFGMYRRWLKAYRNTPGSTKNYEDKTINKKEKIFEGSQKKKTDSITIDSEWKKKLSTLKFDK
jgi:hypothetical protein